jgi:hypothetical protein
VPLYFAAWLQRATAADSLGPFVSTRSPVEVPAARLDGGRTIERSYFNRTGVQKALVTSDAEPCRACSVRWAGTSERVGSARMIGMEFEVLAAWSSSMTVRSFADGRDWSYGITFRDGRREMADWFVVRSSMDVSLPTVSEAIPPYRFACQEARRRGLVD